MVQQIMPEQIPKFWEAAKDLIEDTIPDIHGESPQKMNNILSKLLDGSMILWVTFDGVKRKTNGLFITKVIEDDITEVKSLLMYAGHSYYSVGPETWMEGWEAMSKYGKNLGCKRMLVYTDVPFLIEQAKKFGGTTSYTFLDIPF